MRAWREDLDFHALVLAEPKIAGKVPRAKIEHAFDLKRQLKNIDKIFARVFPEKTRRTSITKRSVKNGAAKRRSKSA